MTRIVANGVGIEAETFGSAAAPAILLIQGYAAQMVVWPESLCRGLADRGFYVMRFDNRDVGLSEHFHGVKAPGVARSFLASILGIRLRTPYTLDDMARDSVGVLDAFNVAEAHIVGASMGGMIAQLVAAHHGNRARSLVSIMSTSGNRKLPPPKPRLVWHVLFRQRKKAPRERLIKAIVSLWELLESPGYPTSREERVRKVSSWVDRDSDRLGCFRQFAAMAASGDRSELLGSIARPHPDHPWRGRPLD